MTPARRRAVTAAVLATAGLVAIVGGVRAEASRADGATPSDVPAGRGRAPALTPVLSARRVPDLLVRPQAGRRLADRLAPLMSQAPPTSCLVVADGTTTLFAQQPDTPMPAASNQKLVTAIAALDVLGPDTTFTTRLAAAAAPVDGVVDGDLWMIGGGDPVIDSDTYQATLRYGRTEHTAIERIADDLVAAGVRRIAGSIRGDDSHFDRVRTVPTWPDRYLQQNQVGPLSALSVNDARMYPVVAPSGGIVRPASDPPAYAATALTELLAARGIAVDGPPASGEAPDGLTTILDVRSLPVSELVQQMLNFSDNNTAELLVKSLGVADSGEGSTRAGLEATREALEERGFPLEGVALVDGSGLDTSNRVTCRLLSEILRVAGPSGPLAEGLAVADGADGTLRDRFRGSPAAGRVRAKTGTLRGVTALSGWVTTDSGAQVRFANVINTGGRDVTGADLTLEARVAEAILSYPDSVNPLILGPRVTPP